MLNAYHWFIKKQCIFKLILYAAILKHFHINLNSAVDSWEFSRYTIKSFSNNGSFLFSFLSFEVWVHLWIVYSVSLIYVSILVPVSFSFDYRSSVIWFEIRDCDISSLVLLFKAVLTIWSLLCFHRNFLSLCSSSMKNYLGIFW